MTNTLKIPGNNISMQLSKLHYSLMISKTDNFYYEKESFDILENWMGLALPPSPPRFRGHWKYNVVVSNNSFLCNALSKSLFTYLLNFSNVIAPWFIAQVIWFYIYYQYIPVTIRDYIETFSNFQAQWKCYQPM